MKTVLSIPLSMLTMVILVFAGPASAQVDNYMFGSPNGLFLSNAPENNKSVMALDTADGYLRINKPEEALKHYKIAAEAQPTTNAYIGLGRSYVALAEYDQAVTAFRTLFDGSKVVTMASAKEAGVLAPYALALSLSGHDSEALEIYRSAVRRLREEGRGLMPVPLPDFGEGENKQSDVPRLTLQAAARVATAICRNGASWPTENQIEHARLAAWEQPEAAWAHFYYGRALALKEYGVKDTQYCKYWEAAKSELVLAARLGGLPIAKETEPFLKFH